MIVATNAFIIAVLSNAAAYELATARRRVIPALHDARHIVGPADEFGEVFGWNPHQGCDDESRDRAGHRRNDVDDLAVAHPVDSVLCGRRHDVGDHPGDLVDALSSEVARPDPPYVHVTLPVQSSERGAAEQRADLLMVGRELATLSHRSCAVAVLVMR
ncbi:hypothetical protein [Aeromicrobium sp. UC242_57]|uniref:hypothetical protein n=1 Tax=Aeromicrobium sp. UC242_57 TaxID=3374624 RepID=UPI003793330B